MSKSSIIANIKSMFASNKPRALRIFNLFMVVEMTSLVIGLGTFLIKVIIPEESHSSMDLTYLLTIITGIIVSTIFVYKTNKNNKFLKEENVASRNVLNTFALITLYGSILIFLTQLVIVPIVSKSSTDDIKYSLPIIILAVIALYLPQAKNVLSKLMKRENSKTLNVGNMLASMGIFFLTGKLYYSIISLTKPVFGYNSRGFSGSSIDASFVIRHEGEFIDYLRVVLIYIVSVAILVGVIYLFNFCGKKKAITPDSASEVNK